jgi:hypothetical protein
MSEALLNYRRIRNEAIQMFRELPDNQRGTLLRRVVANPSTPVEVTDPDSGPISYLGRGFYIFVERERTSPNWAELHELLASLVVNGMRADRAAKLYYIFHQELLAMGVQPPAAAVNPPAVDWIQPRMNNYAAISQVVGRSLGDTYYVPPPTPADHAFPGSAPAPAPAPAPAQVPAQVPVQVPAPAQVPAQVPALGAASLQSQAPPPPPPPPPTSQLTPFSPNLILPGLPLQMEQSRLTEFRNAVTLEPLQNNDLVDVLYTEDQARVLLSGNDVPITPAMVLLTASADGHFAVRSTNPFTRERVGLRVRRRIVVPNNQSAGKSRRNKRNQRKRNQRKRKTRRSH